MTEAPVPRPLGERGLELGTPLTEPRIWWSGGELALHHGLGPGESFARGRLALRLREEGEGLPESLGAPCYRRNVAEGERGASSRGVKAATLVAERGLWRPSILEEADGMPWM